MTAVDNESLPFKQRHADRILERLSEEGAALPKRFLKPSAVSSSELETCISEDVGLIRIEWAKSLSEVTDALNNASLDGNNYAEGAAAPQSHARHLGQLRKSTNTILSILTQKTPTKVPTHAPTLEHLISEQYDLDSSNPDLQDLLHGLEGLSDAVIAVADAIARRNKQNLGTKGDVDDKISSTARPTKQSYRIRCYRDVFTQVLGLDPEEHTNRLRNNFTGAYPTFIKETMCIDTRWTPSSSALTKALERSETIRQTAN